MDALHVKSGTGANSELQPSELKPSERWVWFGVALHGFSVCFFLASLILLFLTMQSYNIRRPRPIAKAWAGRRLGHRRVKQLAKPSRTLQALPKA